MGYYTMYSLEHDCTDREKFSRIVAEMEKLGILDYALSANEDLMSFDTTDCVKWYECEDDMRKISNLFPDVLFTLHGEGEESGDLWNAYFRGGKEQYCQAKIIFDEFDPEKLV